MQWSIFEVIMEGLQQNKMTTDQIDMLIPHQANLRISQFIQRKFGLNDDQVYNNIMLWYTNCGIHSHRSDRSMGEGKIKSGDLVVLAAFGSGFVRKVL